MDYISWNLRRFTFFKEELLISDNIDSTLFPSINNFKQEHLYSEPVRRKLISYLESAIPVVATTYFRKNAYTGKELGGLGYYTDGEVLFTDLLIEYMKYPDFVLPVKWFELILQRNFQPPVFDRVIGLEETDEIFSMADETFDTEPAFKKSIQ